MARLRVDGAVREIAGLVMLTTETGRSIVLSMTGRVQRLFRVEPMVYDLARIPRGSIPRAVFHVTAIDERPFTIATADSSSPSWGCAWRDASDGENTRWVVMALAARALPAGLVREAFRVSMADGRACICEVRGTVPDELSFDPDGAIVLGEVARGEEVIRDITVRGASPSVVALQSWAFQSATIEPRCVAIDARSEGGLLRLEVRITVPQAHARGLWTGRLDLRLLAGSQRRKSMMVLGYVK